MLGTFNRATSIYPSRRPEPAHGRSREDSASEPGCRSPRRLARRTGSKTVSTRVACPNACETLTVRPVGVRPCHGRTFVYGCPRSRWKRRVTRRAGAQRRSREAAAAPGGPPGVSCREQGHQVAAWRQSPYNAAFNCAIVEFSRRCAVDAIAVSRTDSAEVARI